MNQLFIPNSNDVHAHSDILPREEIASPQKIYDVMQCAEHTWHQNIYSGQSFQYNYVMSRKTFPNGNKSIGTYVMTQKPELFLSARNVLNTTYEIYEWLKQWGHELFLVSSPVCQDIQSNTTFFVPNVYPSYKIPILPHHHAFWQMLNSSGYTICNGFTLAIAMHRLGYWDIVDASKQWFDDGNSFHPDITTEWLPLFTSHTISHIADHPAIYAAMGGQPHMIPFIKSVALLEQSFALQVVTPTKFYYTSPIIACLPCLNTRMWEELKDYGEWLYPAPDDEIIFSDVIPDLSGFLYGVTRNRRMKAFWMKRRWAILKSLLQMHDLRQLLKRLFHMYNENIGVHSIVRQIWKDALCIVDTETMYTTVMRYIVVRNILDTFAKHEDIAQSNMNWYPDVPIAFLKDYITYHCDRDDKPLSLCHKKKMYIITTKNELVTQYFGDLVTASENNTVQVNISLLQLLALSPRHTMTYKFYTLLDNRCTFRLCALHKAFDEPMFPSINENEGYTIWMIMQDYLEKNKDVLYV